MENRTYGYERVSTKEQKTDRQRQALTSAGVDERFIFTDKQSGKDFKRPQYQVLKNALREGDMLIVKSLDRLGRNYTEIKNEWKEITQVIKCHIKILDTTIQNKDLTGNFISNIVLEILSYVSEQERANTRSRQAEGIERAKAANKHLGRPRLELPDNFNEVYAKWKQNEISAIKAMNILKLKRSSFYNIVKQYEN